MSRGAKRVVKKAAKKVAKKVAKKGVKKATAKPVAKPQEKPAAKPQKSPAGPPKSFLVALKSSQLAARKTNPPKRPRRKHTNSVWRVSRLLGTPDGPTFTSDYAFEDYRWAYMRFIELVQEDQCTGLGSAYRVDAMYGFGGDWKLQFEDFWYELANDEEKVQTRIHLQEIASCK